MKRLAQFSSERFEEVISTLEWYRPEEGLRPLRENDPKIASQIEGRCDRAGNEEVYR